jgi:hypothetical protein
MPTRLPVGSATIVNELSEDAFRLDQMLSSIRSSRESEKLVRVRDSMPHPPGNATKMGSEGLFWDDGVDFRVHGRRFGFEGNDKEMTVYAGGAAAFPLLLPFLLSTSTDGYIASLHACGVQAAGQGILIGGPGGSGRTGVLLELVERGAGFVTDDVCMVSRNGDMISCGPNLKLRFELGQGGLKDNLEPVLRHRNPFPRRIMAKRRILQTAAFLAGATPERVGRRIVAWSRGLGSSVEIDSRSFWPEGTWVPKCDIDRVLICSPGPGEPRMSKIGSEDAGRRLVAVNRFELRDYLELLQLIAFARPELGENLMDSFHNSEETVRESVSRAECFIVAGNRSRIQTYTAEAVLGGSLNGRD